MQKLFVQKSDDGFLDLLLDKEADIGNRKSEVEYTGMKRAAGLNVSNYRHFR